MFTVIKISKVCSSLSRVKEINRKAWWIFWVSGHGHPPEANFLNGIHWHIININSFRKFILKTVKIRWEINAHYSFAYHLSISDRISNEIDSICAFLRSWMDLKIKVQIILTTSTLQNTTQLVIMKKIIDIVPYELLTL